MNSDIKYYFDTDFMKNPNPHKYAVLWSSKFYRKINEIMRSVRAEVILKDYKYSRYFIKKFVRYFYSHGVQKDRIGCDIIYRGYNADFRLHNVVADTGFIATSKLEHVAREFAGKKGRVICFDTRSLPHNVPYIVIDERVSDDLLEQEVLLLPGTLHISNLVATSNLKSLYIPNMEFINAFRDIDNSGGGNGDEEMMVGDAEMNLPLEGKVVVWYRAIEGRRVEVMTWYNIPKDENDVMPFFKSVVYKIDDRYRNFMTFIPEYIDLLENDNKTLEEIKRMHSFMCHIAIFDPHKRKVDTIRYGVHEKVFGELFDLSREKEVEDCLVKYFADWE